MPRSCVDFHQNLPDGPKNPTFGRYAGSVWVM
ncbi:MAG: hypothetical protein QOD90_3700 [Mycobacterium sp.]|nr:hypothetical protein [Mycobacterium sp.]